jgi:hypothetical protein
MLVVFTTACSLTSSAQPEGPIVFREGVGGKFIKVNEGDLGFTRSKGSSQEPVSGRNGTGATSVPHDFKIVSWQNPYRLDFRI